MSRTRRARPPRAPSLRAEAGEAQASGEATGPEGHLDEADPGADTHPCCEQRERVGGVDPNGAGRDPGEGARGALKRRGADGGRCREGDWSGPSDCQHDALEAGEERRGRQGRPWLPPPQHRARRNPGRTRGRASQDGGVAGQALRKGSYRGIETDRVATRRRPPTRRSPARHPLPPSRGYASEPRAPIETKATATRGTDVTIRAASYR